MPICNIILYMYIVHSSAMQAAAKTVVINMTSVCHGQDCCWVPHHLAQMSWLSSEVTAYVTSSSKREVRGSKPTATVLCPWARHFTPRKYWLITQEAMAPSRHDWKIVDWDVKPQHNQPTNFQFKIGPTDKKLTWTCILCYAVRTFKTISYAKKNERHKTRWKH